MSDLVTATTLVTALACGLVGGVFFAFSNFVMAALGRRPDAEGIAAMQAINVTVINPGFMAPLFGAVLLCLGLAVWAIRSLGDHGSPWVLAGALLYTIGCAGVTVVANVPLNDELERMDPGDPGAAAVWRRYLRRWTRWNTVRTAAALAAAAMLVVGAMEG